jgi:hypothetical protein
MDDNSRKILRNNTKHLEASFNHSIKVHNTICKNNNIDCSEYLENLIEDLRERNSLEHVTIKQILHREKSRNDFRTIKQTLNPRIFKGVQHLDIPVEGATDRWI